MKRMLAFSIAFLLCVFSFPLAAAEADTEKTVLKVYNWGEYISNGEDDSLDVIKEFERQNQDITVEYTTYATNEEMYAKIASGSAEYDVLIPSDYMIGKMIEEDMLAKLDFDHIPNFKYIDEQFRNPEFDPSNEYSVPYTWGTVGIIYNTTKVDETVDSWDILWDEKYSGQILMFDNPRDAYGIAMKKLGYSQNTTDRDKIDEATELLKQQKSVVQAYVMDQIFAKMPNGEAALAPYYAGDAITMIDENPDLAFVVPKEGSNQFIDSMVVPKTSKNKEAAERFINFMLEPEIAKANIEYIGYSTPMSVVRDMLDEELRDSTICYPDESVLEKCDTFINLDAETTTYMQDSWTDVLSYGDSNLTAIIILCVVGLLIVAAVVFLLIRKKRNS
jgi:spermidine/putrescine transport system substrate-binding protein